MRKARGRLGAYFPLSRAFTVCLETSRNSASSAWVQRRSRRRSLSRFFIVLRPPTAASPGFGVRCEHDAFLSRSHPYGTLPGLRYTPSGTALARRALANQPAGNAAAAHARDTERRNPNLRSFMSTVDLPAPGAPLTLLSDDEEAFRDAVREFARNEVAPLVQRMDEAQEMDSGLIR